MPEPIPLPAHAASFWVAGDELWIAFPGQGPEERGSTIHLPATVAGLQAVLAILRDRARATSFRLSEKGTPSQYDLEKDTRYRTIIKVLDEQSVEDRAARELALTELEVLGL